MRSVTVPGQLVSRSAARELRQQPRNTLQKTRRLCTQASSGLIAPGKGRVLVLGGTGFVGSAICEKLLDAQYEVVSVSRRGAPVSDMGWPPQAVCANVDWRTGDARDPGVARAILEEKGGFTAVVHAIGMLLESDWNRYASGSGSIPAAGSTFDEVTRQTALNAAASAADFLERPANGSPPPFVFVSAAEAAWPFEAPLPFLRRYLTAKKAVERALLEDYLPAGRLRPSVMRPSLVWTPRRPGALPAVGAFTAFNAAGVPYIDRPVNVETLASAVLGAITFEDASGIYDYKGMDALEARVAAKEEAEKKRGRSPGAAGR